MAENNVVKLEAISTTDGAWYDCEVTPDYSKNASKPRLRIHFTEFTSAEDEWVDSVDDALASIRSRSKPMEVEDCDSVKEGQIVLTLQRRKVETKYFDAMVFKIKREKHRAKNKCSCSFEMKWMASELAGKRVILKFSALCILTEKDPKCNPEFAEWLKARNYTWEPAHTSNRNGGVLYPATGGYIPEPEPELDQAQLNEHVKELLQKVYPGTIKRLKSNLEWDNSVAELGLQIKQVLSAKVSSLTRTGTNGVGPGDIVHEAVVVGPGVEDTEKKNVEKWRTDDSFDVFAAQDTFECSCGTVLRGQLEISVGSPGKSFGGSRMCFCCFVESRKSFLAATCFRLCHLTPDDLIKALSLLMKLEKLPKLATSSIPPISFAVKEYDVPGDSARVSPVSHMKPSALQFPPADGPPQTVENVQKSQQSNDHLQHDVPTVVAQETPCSTSAVSGKLGGDIEGSPIGFAFSVEERSSKGFEMKEKMDVKEEEKMDDEKEEKMDGEHEEKQDAKRQEKMEGKNEEQGDEKKVLIAERLVCAAQEAVKDVVNSLPGNSNNEEAVFIAAAKIEMKDGVVREIEAVVETQTQVYGNSHLSPPLLSDRNEVVGNNLAENCKTGDGVGVVSELKPGVETESVVDKGMVSHLSPNVATENGTEEDDESHSALGKRKHGEEFQTDEQKMVILTNVIEQEPECPLKRLRLS